MKLQNVLESRSAPLYHWMNGKKAIDVLEHDKFTQLWVHDTPEGTLTGISLSRNANFTYGEKAVRLVFDQAKLATRYKLVPLDAERAFHHSIGTVSWYNRKDRKMNAADGQQYAEEFVIGSIEPIHKYLLKIVVSRSALLYGEARTLIAVIEEYCNKYNLPLSLAPEVIRAKDEWDRLDDE